MTASQKKFNPALIPVIFTLAWPTMLEQFMSVAVQYIDTAMVGSLGTYATAAVGSTTTVNWLVGSTISAMSVGFLAYISQAKGAEDYDRVHKASAQSVLIVLIAGILFTVVTASLSQMVPVWMQVDPSLRQIAGQYFLILYLPMLFRAATTVFSTVLRAIGDTKTPMKNGVIVNIANVVMNFLLIYQPRTLHIFGLSVPMWGAGMGVIGAAVASALAFVLGGILITVKLFRQPEVSPLGWSMKPDKEVLVPCLRIALPNMLQRFATSFGYVIFASMINSLGGLSTASHTIANTVESAFYIPGYGMMTAAATLTGNAIGARDRERLKQMPVMIIFCEVSMMIISGTLLFLFAPDMVSVFSHDPDVIALCSKVLRMVACSEPFYGISIVIEGMLMGAGQTKVPFILNVSGMWCIRILGTFLCIHVFHLGLISAWVCMISHNMAVFVCYLLYYKRGTWNPIREEAVSN
ncbi:MAG: MATE family efflux transporter [Erysipelotrichaceae bacterium]|nr:MATE family efflux transporter [Erysipelotrichaceae bacterium]